MISPIPFSNKTILVCPLDWGLGHASRCVPLIQKLLASNNRVIVACTKWQRDFLSRELQSVEYVSLLGYDVKYPEKGSFGLKILSQFPRLSMVVKKEHAWLDSFLKENKVDVVISDNRFGLYNKKVESVFITHQLFVPSPFLKSVVNKMNSSFIKKYNQCWVPDHKSSKECLSGALSHSDKMPENVKFIGPLSRFSSSEKLREKRFDVLVLLSGVEPQRSLLESKLVESLAGVEKVALVRGTHDKTREFADNFTVIDSANTAELAELLLSSERIICRSGYSTLMDLHALGLKALLVPTPGQTEQEYLAGYWKEKFGFEALPQAEISRGRIAQWLSLKEIPQPQKRSA